MSPGDHEPGQSVPPADDGADAPLTGFRVVEFCHFLAGPYAGLLLADLGADVIKLEDPGRPDEARSMGPHFMGHQSLYFAALNWGKRSVGLSLGTPAGQSAARDLLASADVLISNYRPPVLERLGLDGDTLHRTHSHLVTCSLTGFGETGPDAQRAGYDYTIQAATGVMGLAGEPNGPPVKAGISYVDHAGGLAAAFGVCAGLLRRARTGVGGHVDLGLFDVQVSMLSYLAAWSLNAGFEPVPMADSAHPSLVPAQNFRVADGWLTLFVGNDSMWARLVEELGDEVLADPAYARREGRAAHRREVVDRLGACLRQDTAERWSERLGRVGVACAPVRTVGEALRDPQVAARNLVARADDPDYGSYRHVTGPIPALSTGASAGAPMLGQHTAEVLGGLGYDPSMIDAATASPAVV